MISKKLLTTIAFAFVLLFSGCAKDDFDQIDGVCPLVVSTVPKDKAIDVPLDQIITATFNEKMNPTTISGASFTISANGALIDGTVSYNGLTATFDPKDALEPDTEYTGTITTMAKDERGNALQEDYVWTFTTLPEYTVTIITNPTPGPITTGAGVYLKGTAVPITAALYENYTFINWTTVGGVFVSNLPTYTLPPLMDNVSLVANYTINAFEVILEVNPPNSGTTDGARFYNFGSTATVKAIANTEYNFVNWTNKTTGLPVSPDAEYSFTVNGTTTLVANFVLKTYTLDVTIIGSGTVTKSPVNGPYNHGSIVTLTAQAATDFVFTGWSGPDGTGIISPLPVTMDGNKNITATFTAKIIPVNAGLCPNPEIDLGSARNYAILAETAITTTGVTSITGDVGISPNKAIGMEGFTLIMDSGGKFSTSNLVDGKIYASDYTPPTPLNVGLAIGDMKIAYDAGMDLAPTAVTNYNGGNLSNETLVAGVYKFGTDLNLTNTITLDGGNTDCAAFVFQISGKLIVNPNTKIILINGAKADNIYWVVAGSGATLNTDVDFSGTILSQTLISLAQRTVVNGRLLAQSAVTLIGNTVVMPSN